MYQLYLNKINKINPDWKKRERERTAYCCIRHIPLEADIAWDRWSCRYDHFYSLNLVFPLIFVSIVHWSLWVGCCLISMLNRKDQVIMVLFVSPTVIQCSSSPSDFILWMSSMHSLTHYALICSCPFTKISWIHTLDTVIVSTPWGVDSLEHWFSKQGAQANIGILW